mgnify:CR=1 FL=1
MKAFITLFSIALITGFTYAQKNKVPADAGKNQEICLGQSVQLNASGGSTYKWSPAEGLSDVNIPNPVAKPTRTIFYTVTVTEGKHSATDQVRVEVHEPPEANAGEDFIKCDGLEARLTASGGTSYSWSPAANMKEPASPTPVVNPTTKTTYTVTVTDEHGCSATDDITVDIKPKVPFSSCGSKLNYLGKSYSTVKIDDQCWMAENLNAGQVIDRTKNQLDNGEIEKYCYHNNPQICLEYGGLYQWDEVMQHNQPGIPGICPCGWHVPTDEEWQKMEIHLGMNQIQASSNGYNGTDQGKKLKKGGSTGFNAIMPGYRKKGGFFEEKDTHTYFWTATEEDRENAWRRILGADFDSIGRSYTSKEFGYSVRCVKD